MPQKPRFTREELVDAGLEIVRAGGASALTARAVGARLGCSARPIFTVFENMDDLGDAVFAAAQAELIGYLSESVDYWPAFKEFGLRYVRFAIEQPHLYEMIFSRNGAVPLDVDSIGSLFLDLADTLTGEVQCLFGLSRENARELFNQMIVFANGIASLSVGGTARFTEEQVSRSISEVCVGMVFRFKVADGSFDIGEARAMASQPDIAPRKRAQSESLSNDD